MGPRVARRVNVYPLAVSKLVLHGLKYPHLPVGGVLLGQISGDSTDTPVIHLMDAVPLFHGICSAKLAPMLEVSLMLAEVAARKQNLKLAGYYVLGDELPVSDPAVQSVAERLLDQFPSACVVTLTEGVWRSMPPFIPGGESLNVTQWVEGSPVSCPKASISLEDSESLNAIISLFFGQKKYTEIIDMDNHLDDISLDWENKQLTAAIQTMLKEH